MPPSPADNQPTANTPIWKNGQWVGENAATVSVFDHGLLYGDGCFEGLRFYHNQPFRPARHVQRLQASARALGIDLPWSAESLIRAISDCAAAAGRPAGYIRVLVTRGNGDFGLNPANCHTPNVFVIPATLAMVSPEARHHGIALMISSVRRMVGSGLDGRIKSLNYLHSVLARAEANAAGANEAVLLNQHGTIAECSAENLFVVRDGALLTPPLTDGALGGITRECLMTLARELSIPVAEQSLTPFDLTTADECFITGSGAGLIPVRSVSGRAIGSCPGEYYTQLLDAYALDIERECGLVSTG